MVVSMMQFVLEIPWAGSIKEKRSVVSSVKDRLQRRFKLSVAEIDLQRSIGFAHMGAAVVSNSRQHGEKILNKALTLLEEEIDAGLRDVEIYSENF
ncbi:MAG: DUF503 domain-containing protein [Spirochaetales bacterium]|nr:DUF503 domain-containing protein [Spirochaetales bacterium]MCF7937917.1 DUF503 domain-containing protein [Spirochaetales bacterium]